MKKSSLFFLLTEVRGQIWFDLNFIRVRCQLRSTWPVSKPIQMRRSLLVKRRAYIEWLRSIPLSMGWTWLVCILMKQKWAVFAFLTFAIYRTKNPHFWTKFMVFYCAMHFSAKRGIAIACRLSVCLSVRPSVRLCVTLVDCDHIGWNSSKIISPLVSMGCSIFATPTWRVCSEGNTPKFGHKVTHPLLIWASETFDRKLRPNGYR